MEITSTATSQTTLPATTTTTPLTTTTVTTEATTTVTTETTTPPENITTETTLTSNSTTVQTVNTTFVQTTSATTETSEGRTTDISTVTDSQTTYSSEKLDDGGMGVGPMMGIIVGAIVIVVFILILLILVYRRRKKKHKHPRPIPKLPSASDVDKTIGQLKGYTADQTQKDMVNMHDITPEMGDDHELYKNLDKDGKPNENTNPHVGADGYLKKTTAGIDYLNEGKKKGGKKKLRNKFNKGKKKQYQQETVNQRVDTPSSKSDHHYENRAVSDLGYSEGRAADALDKGYAIGGVAEAPEQGYSHAKELGKGKKKKKKKEHLYENTEDPRKKYANVEQIQHDKTTVTEEEYYNINLDDDSPKEIYENT